jgi:hypothetical protein
MIEFALTITMIIGLGVLVTCFYFLPSIVGLGRGARNIGTIIAVNGLLGWSVIGWAVAMVLAAPEPESPTDKI